MRYHTFLILLIALGCSPCNCEHKKPWVITERKSTPRATPDPVETPVDPPLVTGSGRAPDEPGAGEVDRPNTKPGPVTEEPEAEPQAPEAQAPEAQAPEVSDVYLVKWSATWCDPCKFWDRDHRPTILAEPGMTITDLDFYNQGGREAGVEKLPAFAFCSRSTGKKVYPLEGYLYGTSADKLLEGLRQSVKGEAAPEAAPNVPNAVQAAGDPAAATVRVKIQNGKYIDIGTGTVVRSSGSESLVLTASHLFNMGGRVTVEVFDQGRTYPGTLLRRTTPASSDCAVVRLAVGGLKAVEVSGAEVKRGDKLKSIGCSNGADPTTVSVEVLHVNYYSGPENLICSTFPAQGRSGGGLFNAAGDLVGICTARRDGHGLYTGAKPLQDILK